MNSFEHAEYLAELTAMGAHELAKRVVDLEGREAALAAHVERFCGLVKDAWRDGFDAENSDDIDFSYAVTIANSQRGEHAKSLDRRDALNKAEAMDFVLAQSCNEENEGVMWRTKIVEPEIQRLRQQAAAMADAK